MLGSTVFQLARTLFPTKLSTTFIHSTSALL